MRRLLQSLVTRKFLAEDGWTDDCRQAREFKSTFEALLAGLEMPEPTQVIGCFGDPDYSFYITTRAGYQSIASCSLCAKKRLEKAAGNLIGI